MLGLLELLVPVAPRRPPRPTLAASPERMPLTHSCHCPPLGMPNLVIDLVCPGMFVTLFMWARYQGVLLAIDDAGVHGAHTLLSIRGRLTRSARAVQLFGRLAVLETHTLRY